MEAVAKVFPEDAEGEATHAAEALMLSSLGAHRSIVRFLGATARAPRMLVLQWAAGGSLHDDVHNAGRAVGTGGDVGVGRDERIDARRAPAVPAAQPARSRWARDVRRALNVCAALEHMHSLQPPVLHRDVKASNVLLSAADPATGRAAPAASALLCDFGSACVLPANESDSLGIGTPGWMAPELLGADGAVHCGCAADVYSFGALLYELAAGALPYANLAEAEMMRAAASGTSPLDHAPLPADTPAPLSALMRDCLAFDARERPDARRVSERLAELLAELLGEGREGEREGLSCATA